jgi:hypothetical protein
VLGDRSIRARVDLIQHNKEQVKTGEEGGREGGRAATRTSDDVLGNSPISARVNLIQHNKEQVKTGEERIGQADVFLDGAMLVILAIDGVGRGEDRAAGIEGGVDAGLGDGDGLLLHDFVDSHLLEGRGGREGGRGG